MLSCFVALIFSCSNSTLTEAELKAYVLNEENGLVKKSSRGDFQAEAYHRPNDLVIAQMAYDKSLTKDTLDSLRTAYSDFSYFVLHMSKNNREVESYFAYNPILYNEIVNYLNGEIDQDMMLLHKSDTIKALQTIYSPALGSSNYTSVMAVFGTGIKQLPPTIELVWNDTQLNTGVHRFLFNKSDLKNTPQLKL
jgi:hypothetical protein